MKKFSVTALLIGSAFIFLAGCSQKTNTNDNPSPADPKKNQQSNSSATTGQNQDAASPKNESADSEQRKASSTHPREINSSQPGQAPRDRGTSTPGAMRDGQMPDGQQPFFGTITSVSENTLKITGMDNAAVTITLADETKYADGTKTDLKAGTKIAGSGTEADDGNILAGEVRINPTMPEGGPGGMPRDGGQMPENQ